MQVSWQRGSATIQAMGLVVITIMMSSLAIDFGFYQAAQDQLQTAADAAALAAVTELYNSVSVTPEDRQADATVAAEELAEFNWNELTVADSDIIWGFVDPDTRTYDPATFTTPSGDPDYDYTGGFNAVRVSARKTEQSANGPLPTVMARVFGVNEMNASASSVALIDSNIGAIADGGLRPIYACQGLMDVAMADGDITNDIIRIYGDQVYVNGVSVVANCPAPGSGNWGFADLTDCGSGAVGVSTLRDWWADGFPGSVSAGQCYSTQPGNPISAISNELDDLISNQTKFPIPVYNSWGGNGSNTHVDITGFVGFQITSYVGNGAQASRYIQGKFVTYVCSNGCTSASGGGSLPGGGVVKLRLAGR